MPGAFELVVIVAAGLWAGMINTIVGSGTLVTFPTLLFFGYPPVTANVSNTLGMVAGGMSGVWGYRAEVRGLGATIGRLAPASFLGAVIGAALLLVLPPAAFEAIVPVLIIVGVALVILGPKINAAWPRSAGSMTTTRWVAVIVGVFVAGIYGGYFGAAQGVILVGIMSVLLPVDVQAINGIKNILALIANLVAALVFLVISPDRIDWWVVAAIACGAFLGGLLGARVGRAMPPTLLRSVIVAIGIAAVVYLLAI